MTTTSPASPARQPAPTRSRNAIRGGARLFNPLAMLLAGTRWLPLYGVIEHRGRRSGRLFRTPVVVRPAPDGFIVPMPWGEGTDWYRNVRAAAGCAIRWKGRDYQLVDPEVIDLATARPFFSSLERIGVRRFGIRQCLRLRYRRA